MAAAETMYSVPASELEIGARGGALGEQLDHELPVEAEIDDAGEVRQPVDQLEQSSVLILVPPISSGEL